MLTTDAAAVTTPAQKLWATQNRASLLELAARLPREVRPFLPDLTAVAVTFTESTTQTVTTNYREYSGTSPEVTPLGTVPTTHATGYVYNIANAFDGASMHFGFALVGDTVEIAWRAKTTGGNKYWIYINGKPMTATTVVTTLTTTSPNTYYAKLVFPSVALWDVRIYTVQMDLVSIRTPITQTLDAVPPRPLTIAMVGDSYGESVQGSDDLQVWPKVVADLLGAEEQRACQAGTGFTKNGGAASKGVFGDYWRLLYLAQGNPRLIVGVGGTNDNLADPTVLNTVATSFFATLAQVLPNTPVIWFGPQALNSTQSVANAAQASQNKAIRDACLASPNVLAHVDMLGHARTGVVPLTYATGQNVGAGELRVYNGAIYQAVAAAASTPSAPDRNSWRLLSWLTGTGNVASPAGNGNRDLLLSSDGTHPTPLGQQNIGIRVAQQVVSIVRSAAASVA